MFVDASKKFIQKSTEFVQDYCSGYLSNLRLP